MSTNTKRMYYGVENKSNDRLSANQPDKKAAIEVAFEEFAARKKSVESKRLEMNLYRMMDEDECVGYLRALGYEVVTYGDRK